MRFCWECSLGTTTWNCKNKKKESGGIVLVLVLVILTRVMLGIPPCLLCEWHCSNIRSLPKTRQKTQPANVGLQCTTNHTHEGIDWQQEKERKKHTQFLEWMDGWMDEWLKKICMNVMSTWICKHQTMEVKQQAPVFSHNYSSSWP